MTAERSYYIENLGCAKNQVDAEVMIKALHNAGWSRCSDPGDAGVIIVNTCGFIEPAKEESVDVLISFRDAFPDAVVVAAGCLSQRYSGELAESMPELDGIFGNSAVSLIPEFLADQSSAGGQLISVPELADISPETSAAEDALSINRAVILSGASSAFVKLAEGCSNNCSFCAIPLIRGPVRSRAPESIVKEVKKLAKSGVREINLIAQDLGSYGMDLANEDGNPCCLLPLLLRELNKLSGDFIIRMLYIHPDNFPYEILDICEGSDKILPYFDIPFQHASESILAAMNRLGNAEKHLALLNDIRNKLPEAVIRTTFLLGFPGETKADIEELEAFISAARLEWAGFFIYSPEEDTPAFGMESERRYKRRQKAVQQSLKGLQELQSGITEEVLKRFIDRQMSLLVEEAVEEEDLYLCRAWMQAPEVDGLVVLNAKAGSLKPGQMVQGKIKALNGIDLEADLLA